MGLCELGAVKAKNEIGTDRSWICGDATMEATGVRARENEESSELNRAAPMSCLGISPRNLARQTSSNFPCWKHSRRETIGSLSLKLRRGARSRQGRLVLPFVRLSRSAISKRGEEPTVRSGVPKRLGRRDLPAVRIHRGSTPKLKRGAG